MCSDTLHWWRFDILWTLGISCAWITLLERNRYCVGFRNDSSGVRHLGTSRHIQECHNTPRHIQASDSMAPRHVTSTRLPMQPRTVNIADFINSYLRLLIISREISRRPPSIREYRCNQLKTAENPCVSTIISEIGR